MTTTTTTTQAPPTFTDAAGRVWPIRLTIGGLKAIKAASGVDLATVFRSETALVGLLNADPEVLGRVLHAATGAEVPEEDFFGVLDGPALAGGFEALLMAAADLLPRSRVAAAIKANVGRVLAEIDATAVAALERVMLAGSTPDASPADGAAA